MEILYLMLPIMTIIGLLILVFFIWAVKSGQYEDLETQKYRIFFDD
jgi:cbb3-type cytochrome oxidase maturation protein